MILMIILGVLVLLFCFVAFMVSKNWRWTHVTLLVLTFFATIGAMILSAAVLRTHEGWRTGYEKLAKQLEDTETKLANLRQADVLSEDPESVPRLRGELDRLIIDRGRVWRNAIPTVGDGVIDLNMARWGDQPCTMVGLELDEFAEPEPEPLEEGGEAAADGQPAANTAQNPHGLIQGMIVHAFLEVPVGQMNDTQKAALFARHNLPELDAKGVCRIPGAFLGGFQIMQAGETGISVEPLDEPTEAQAALMEQGSWVLYEILPRDSHQTLADLTPEQVKSMFDFAAKVTQADAEILAGIEQSVAEFARDKTPAEESDPEERTMVRVKFLKDHTIDVDVEEAEAGIEQGKFDPRGRAQVAELRHGAPVEFKAGDQNYFDAETAQRLSRAGIGEIDKDTGDVFKVYSRELRDYTYLFDERNAQLRELDRQMVTLRDQQRAIEDANQNAKGQIAYREVELTKLGEDLANFKKEVKVITKLKSELAEYRQRQLQTLSYLYHSNLQLRGLE